MVADRLSTRIIYVAIPAAILLIGAGAGAAIWQTDAMLERGLNARLTTAALVASSDVTEFLDQADRELQLVARAPVLASTADAAGRAAIQRGLPAVPIETLEDRFAENRSIGATPLADAFLRQSRDGSGFADLMLTDRHGYTVLSVEETPDFVQSDEVWWRRAWDAGAYVGEPLFDETAGVVALELASRVDAPDGRPVGVLRALVRTARLAARMQAGHTADAVVEVVDSSGRIVISRDSTRLLRVSHYAALLPRSDEIAVQDLRDTTGGVVLVTAPTARGRWWVVLREPAAVAHGTARTIRLLILGAAGAVLLVIVLVLGTAANWMETRITLPLQDSSRLAGEVAAGDLTSDVPALRSGAPEVRRMLDSLRGMVTELRGLVSGIRGAAEELAAMAQEISASTEEMSASTEEMASTSQRLSDQSGVQAEQIKGASTDAERILAIATQLADGATLAARRSAELKDTAEGHRERLLAGSAQLTALAEEVERSAKEAETLAGLSAEVQQFVTQAKTIATRTNMLALNAAIEAARAGTEGQGFAVVADEVRKLANQAATAAQSTSETVARVLQGVEGTRERLQRLATDSVAVREVADGAARGLEDITERAVENDTWAAEIAQAATDAKQLVAEITERLRSVAEVTENAVAAIEEIAAAAEEQSASTEEIAASASHLAEASERLNAGVSRFRLTDAPTGDAGD